MFQDPTYYRTKGSYICLLTHSFVSSLLKLSSSKSLKELLKLLLYKRICQCNSDKRLQKAGRICLLFNHCNSNTYTDRIGCLADKHIFPLKFRKLHSHLWQKTATSKSSMNNFPHKWLDTQCKSEKNNNNKTLEYLEVSTACLILGTDVDAKRMLRSNCSIYFFLDAVWGHAKAQLQPHARNVQQLFLPRS